MGGPPARPRPPASTFGLRPDTVVTMVPCLDGPYDHPDTQPRVTPLWRPWCHFGETRSRVGARPLSVPDQPSNVPWLQPGEIFG